MLCQRFLALDVAEETFNDSQMVVDKRLDVLASRCDTPPR